MPCEALASAPHPVSDAEKPTRWAWRRAPASEDANERPTGSGVARALQGRASDVNRRQRLLHALALPHENPQNKPDLDLPANCLDGRAFDDDAVGPRCVARGLQALLRAAVGHCSASAP